MANARNQGDNILFGTVPNENRNQPLNLSRLSQRRGNPQRRRLGGGESLVREGVGREDASQCVRKDVWIVPVVESPL